MSVAQEKMSLLPIFAPQPGGRFVVLPGMEPFDLLIVGGGPIGLACGLAAKKAGLRYVILEKGTLVNSLYRSEEHTSELQSH